MPAADLFGRPRTFARAAHADAPRRLLFTPPSSMTRGISLAAGSCGKERPMKTATLVSDDIRVRNAVMRQLEWDPGG